MAIISPGLHKFVLNSVDITSVVFKESISKSRNQPVKTMSFLLNRNVLNLLPFDDTILGKEITVQRGFDSATERYIFRGEVVSYKVQGSLFSVTASDKLYVTSRRDYDYSFDINTDTEAGVGSEIVKTLLTFAGLSYSSSSIISTGTDTAYKIVKYPAKGSILNTLKDLCRIYNYQIFYQDSDDLVYFIPKGYIPTSTVLTTGTDIRNRIQWNTSVEDTSNNITIIGGEQLDWNTETFAATASTVTLTATPVDTDVYVNTTTKVLRGVNSTSPNDFYVDGKNLVFTIPRANIVVNYSYNVPTKTTATNYESISNYNQRDVTIINDKLTNTSDTELRASQYLEEDSNPVTSAPLFVIGNNDLELGQQITVNDTVNNVSKNVIITSIEYNYPYSYDNVVIGKVPVQNIDIQIGIMDAISKLQRQLAAETEINTQLFNLPQNIETVGYSKVETAPMDADALYWDSDTQGTWDDFNWGTDTEETYAISSLVPINQTVYENFRSTEFKDGSSTATWGTTGSCTFTNGQIALSTYYVKDTDLTITKVTLTASATGTLVYEISCNGTDWETVTNGTQLTVVNTGSYIYWRATSTGVSTLSSIQIVYS